MKVKRIGLIAAVLFFNAAMVFAGGRQSGGGGTSEITVVNSKIEIDQQLKDYAAVYERLNGVRVNVRSIGGETSYSVGLTAMQNSGTEPEIYAFEGDAGFLEAKQSGRLTDLSGEAWVRQTDVAYKDTDGKVYGFPLAVEGWGLGYNKDILQRAGINPAALTNVAAMRAAFERLDSMKAQLGIDAVVSMTAGPGMEWVTGNHGFNGYLALGLGYSDTRYIDMLLGGQADTARLTKFAEYYNMLFQYSDRNILLVGGYDEQVGAFAMQKAAFVHQGNWIDGNLAGLNFNMGYIPHPFLDENTDGIYVGPPWWNLVNARSRNVDAAKKFLNDMVFTSEGQDYMVTKAGMIPAFRNVTLKPSGQLSIAVQEWMNSGKIYAWQQNKMPSGFGMDILGPIFYLMAQGTITPAQFATQAAAAIGRIR